MSGNKYLKSLETLASLCKRRGFIFQSSEIYGGINGFWDYGPMGCELKRNIRQTWWRTMVQEREDIVGIDATIIMHPAIWKASGHLDTFSDPMSTCRACKKLMRSDQVWDMLADSGWGESVAELCPDGTINAGRIAGWAKGKGKSLAPNLAAVRSPDPVLAALNARLQDAGAGPLAMRDLYRLLATDPAASAAAPALPCPYCGGELTEPRPFNLMFKTIVGPVEDPANVAYLRPETAQAIFAQFNNVVATSRQQVPFGIAQMGKSFRNEVTPRNYTFRSREFEQMELEYFIRPDEAIELLFGRVVALADNPDLSEPQDNWGWEVWHKYWVEQRMAWYRKVGLPAESLVEYWQTAEELAHYARACVDIQFSFPFGVQELEGIAARSDFDLSQHQKHSGKGQDVFDEPLKLAAAKLDEAARGAFVEKVATQWAERGKDPEAARAFCAKLFEGRYVPHVIEPSGGTDRIALAVLCQAYDEEWIGKDGEVRPGEPGKQPPQGFELRTVMRFAHNLAPIKAGVFPLLKNKPELVAKARSIFAGLRKRWMVFYDESGAIGRRYRRMDEVGTPYGITVDFQTLEDGTVTLRDRDSMKQIRVPATELETRIASTVEA